MNADAEDPHAEQSTKTINYKLKQSGIFIWHILHRDETHNAFIL